MTARTKPSRASNSPSRVSQTAPASKSASSNVWAMLERSPDFNARVDRGKAQLDAGERVEFEPDDDRAR
ncbi:MAG: hypothetical protein AABZ33_07620 [Chloroflexota bacterium]